MKSRRAPLILTILAMALLGGARSASASIIGINNPAALTINGTVDWGLLGGPFTTVPNGSVVAVTGLPGTTVTVSEAVAQPVLLERRDQSSGGWFGSFAPGEKLLYTGNGSFGPITLVFNTPISGFGVQIQPANVGTFTAQINAFDSASNLLGAFAGPNLVSSGAADDSAPFVGVRSTAADISRIVLSVPMVSVGSINQFVINGPVIQSGASISAVPEPTSLLLLGTGIAGLVRRRYRSRR